jgi:hypothetical protein
MFTARNGTVGLALALHAISFFPSFTDLIDHVVMHAFILAIAASVHWINKCL